MLPDATNKAIPTLVMTFLNADSPAGLTERRASSTLPQASLACQLISAEAEHFITALLYTIVKLGALLRSHDRLVKGLRICWVHCRYDQCLC